MKAVARFTVIGLLAGMMIACSAGTTPRKAAATRGSPNFITREMIENSDHRNAYDLVRALRPNWLSRRGAHSITQPQGDVMVYYGSSRIGGTEALGTIDLQAIEYIEFLSASNATQRYGTNHTHGAIQITPRGTTRAPGP